MTPAFSRRAVQGPPPDVLILIHSLRGGGAERVAVQLACAWQREGRVVALATQQGEETDAYTLPEGVQRHCLGLASESGSAPVALWRNARRWWRLRRLLRRLRPRCVVALMTRNAVLAVLAARGLGCRVVVSEHTHPPAQRLPRSWQRLRGFAYARADTVVALTRGTADWLDDHIPGVHTRVIPNAVNWPLPALSPTVAPPADGTRHLLLAVGRLHLVKGFDCLLRAFAPLATAFARWDLAILGEGAERAALQGLVAELGLDGRVHLPGRVGNVGDWYAAADVYVLSSRTEGLSNTLLEAMASGVACVAFDCDTGPREIIRDDVDGVLVRPVADADALAAALGHVMADEALRERLARRAVDVRDRFGSGRVMALWSAVLPARVGR